MKTSANNGKAVNAAERRLPARRDPARDNNAPCWKLALCGRAIRAVRRLAVARRAEPCAARIARSEPSRAILGAPNGEVSK